MAVATLAFFALTLTTRIELRVFRSTKSIDCRERVRRLTLQLAAQKIGRKATIERYRAENRKLQQKLNETSSLIRDLSAKRNCKSEELSTGNKQGIENLLNWFPVAPDCTENCARDTQNDVTEEEEANMWDNFTPHHIYRIVGGPVGDSKPNENDIGKWKRELEEILSIAARELKREELKARQTLTEGYSLFDRTQGTKYVLYYRTLKNRAIFKQTEFSRPFAALRQVGDINIVDTRLEWINIIIALQGRIDRFQDFMEMYVDVCVKNDSRVFLTVVYFGEKGRDEAKRILQQAAIQYDDYKFLTIKGNFSRGRGFTYGAKQWDKGNVLMFFSDVDIVFDRGFINRCRLNASPGGKAYYPILWTFYNPGVAYADKSAHAQFVRTRDTGTWRRSGYGMTCQYRDDFFSVKGFDTRIEGWGGEDVDLYRKFVRSKIEVFRAVDRGIYHLFHEKFCDPNLTPAQYLNCCNNRVRYEASTLHLGLMVLKSRHKRANDSSAN